MDKELARKIGIHLNKPDIQATIEAYVDAELTKIHRKLENCSLEEFPFLKGRAFELRSLLKIRENALNVINMEAKNG